MAANRLVRESDQHQYGGTDDQQENAKVEQ